MVHAVTRKHAMGVIKHILLSSYWSCYTSC